MERYGIKGKLLGEAMSLFKEVIERGTSDSYHQFIIKHTEQELWNVFVIANKQIPEVTEVEMDSK